MRKGLKITSLALVASMALGFGTAVSAAEAADDSIPTPVNSKTVKDNGDGTFDLSLSFEGRVDTQVSTVKTASDVVIVADRSGSMDCWPISSGSSDERITSWASLKNAVDVLTNKVLPEATDNRVSVVTFASDASIAEFTDNSYWTSSAEEVRAELDSRNASGSTDAAEAIEAATTVLGTARDNAEEYVIFMSDGYPNSSSAALEAAENLKTAYPNAKLYTVGIPDCDDDFMKKVAGDESMYYFADDADKLAAAFEGIATTITKGYSEVVINDTLSEYADYAELNEDGTPVFSLEAFDENGDAVSEEFIPEVKYNADTKTVTADIGSVFDDAMVPNKWKYTLTYKVKANDKAVETFKESGYDAVGDENTDAEGNNTSSGKDGFAVSEGSIGFSYRDLSQTINFANPVIQVQVDEESSSEPSEEPSKEPSSEPSKEPSTEPSNTSSDGKEASDVPQTGSTNNIMLVVALFAAAAAVGVVSVKAAGSKKAK